MALPYSPAIRSRPSASIISAAKPTASHRVRNEQNLDGVELGLEFLQLVHELIVEVQAAGCIHQ